MSIRKKEINLIYANILGVVLWAISAIVLYSIFFWIWPNKMNIEELFNPIFNHPFVTKCDNPSLVGIYAGVSTFIIFIIGCVIHEFIHGITWIYATKCKWKDIKFGIIWKYLTPYCHCKIAMTVRQYRLALLMPLWILGVLPSILGIALGDIFVLSFGVIFIVAAVGDIWMAWLLRIEKIDNKIFDHPSKPAYFIFDNEEELIQIKQELNV